MFAVDSLPNERIMPAAMKTFLLTGVIAVGLFAFAAPNAFCQAPTGSITNVIVDSHNTIYDATLTPLQNIQIDIPQDGGILVSWDDPFTQDGKGKLAGSGATTVFATNDPNIAVTFPATYQTKGSIKGNNGITTLKFSSKASGDTNFAGNDRKLTGTVNYSLTINKLAGTITGTNKQKASASGYGSASDTETINDVIPPELGDGSWTLILNFGAPNGTKLQGTATVTLATGQVYPFDFTGTFVDATGQSKLSLKGVDAGTGSKLTVTLQNGFLDTIKGKMAGQTINFID